MHFFLNLKVVNMNAVNIFLFFQNGSVVKTSVANSVGNVQPGQKTTIIQPAQAHTGQQFIVTSKLVTYFHIYS